MRTRQVAFGDLARFIRFVLTHLSILCGVLFVCTLHSFLFCANEVFFSVVLSLYIDLLVPVIYVMTKAVDLMNLMTRVRSADSRLEPV